DGHVTGVQTCALPISSRIVKKQARESIESASIVAGILRTIVGQATAAIVLVAGLWFLDRYAPTVAAIQIKKDLYASLLSTVAQRSEERRVGKEWRQRG